jgi:NAD(P)-dependent dehydrogenase (short-subunit alcohol dehydrogenase family)
VSSHHPLFDLSRRTTIVIGAGSGIGRSAAIGLSQVGAFVHCADIDTESAQSTATSIVAEGGRAEASQLDIRHAEQLEAAFSRIRSERGSLDVVVATPGVNVRKPLLKYTEEEFDRVVGVNLKGCFNVLRAAGSIMLEQRSGSIILFSSIRSVTVEPGQAVYAATKAGIVQMVRTMAAELGPAGVRVNAIAPGVVDTPLTRPISADQNWHDAYATKSALGRWAGAEEMAGPTVFLASDAASYVTGAVLFVDGGWTAVDGRFQPPGMD